MKYYFFGLGLGYYKINKNDPDRGFDNSDKETDKFHR